jgi:8-oxo-dGTP pyrophosphatase MutT (NUDIX family)
MKIHSAWGIVYLFDPLTKEPRFLLIKRHSLSKRIERVAPKWKIEPGEKPEQAALREIHEEAWLNIQQMFIKQELATLSLQLYNDDGKLWVDKDITYFLVHYTGDPFAVDVEDGGGFLGMYKWWTIQDVMGLVYYKDFRELFKKALLAITQLKKWDDFIKNF